MKFSCFKYHLLIIITPIICLLLTGMSMAHELCHVVQQGSFRVEMSSSEGETIPLKGIQSISIDDIVIPAIVTGEENGFRTYEPGEALLGSIFIRVSNDSNLHEQLENWFKENQRQYIRKSISVICLKRDGSEARRFVFSVDFPKEWTLPSMDSRDDKGDDAGDRCDCETVVMKMGRIEMGIVDNGGGDCDDSDDAVSPKFQVLTSSQEGSGTDVDSAWETCSGGSLNMRVPRFLNSSKVIEEFPGDLTVDELVLEGPLTSGRQNLIKCLSAVLNGKDERCTIGILELKDATMGNRNTNARSELKDATMGNRQTNHRTFNYLDCFPTRYAFPKFSASGGDDSLLEERFSFKPERVEG